MEGTAPGRGLKLWLASMHFFPIPGGAQLRFLRYLPRLAERGVETVVVTGTAKVRKKTACTKTAEWSERAVGQTISPERIDGSVVFRIRLPERCSWRRSVVFYRGLSRRLDEEPHRPDVIQMLPSLHPVSIPWLMRLRALGIPLVLAYAVPVELPAQRVKRIVRRLGLRLMYRHVSCVVVASAFMRAHALAHGAGPRIEIIPNGVDLRRFRPPCNGYERQEMRRSLGLGEKETMITAVGALTPQKGTDILLGAWSEVAKRFPNAHLILVGPRCNENEPNWKEFGRKLEAATAASGAANRVHFTGFVSNVEEYLRASDVFVFSSCREAMPNVVLEAMASGLPMVLTPFFGLSEDMGRPDRHYLLAERSSEGLAAATGKLLNSGGLRAALGQQARSWMEEAMDVERSLDRYAALYRELADGG
jgi:glycosyltransferase involved in cell wall biosynthesis